MERLKIQVYDSKEEDILTSTNLIEKGTLIDKVLESVIVNPKIKIDDLLIGDKYFDVRYKSIGLW